MHNENIIKTKRDDHMSGYTYTHPSFGLISVNNTQVGGGGTQLFGSETFNNSYVSIKIKECEVTQDLGKNWYFGKKILTEVSMTPVQYAEMISNPNTTGVPCTIKSTESKGRIESKQLRTIVEFTKSEVERAAIDIKSQALNLSREVGDILSKKGTLKVSDKDAIRKLVNSLVRDVNSNLKFQEKCVMESIERASMEAKADIDHHITGAINKLGVKTLQNADAMQLLMLGSKVNSDE